MLLAISADAQQGGSGGGFGGIASGHGGFVVGLMVAGVAIVVVTIVVIYEVSKKKTVTGCVASKDNVLSVKDEKNEHTYVLSGNTADIKAGERVVLLGKKARSTAADKTLMWEVKKEKSDLGVCQP
jgi:hypothetical protein